jgi:DtxR family transcriptional regulator, Mn-dependent transcriptional regulator
MRKHRLAERLLLDVIGLEWPYVHEEACRWEHVMSDRVERKILQLLDDPTQSPYGNPIPGLAELGSAVPAAAPSETDSGSDPVPLSALNVVATAVEQVVTVRRIGEPAQQDPAVLASLHRAGLVPGLQITVRLAGVGVEVAAPEAAQRLTLTPMVAEHVFVSLG